MCLVARCNDQNREPSSGCLARETVPAIVVFPRWARPMLGISVMRPRVLLERGARNGIVSRQRRDSFPLPQTALLRFWADPGRPRRTCSRRVVEESHRDLEPTWERVARVVIPERLLQLVPVARLVAVDTLGVRTL